MIIVSASHFHVYLLTGGVNVNVHLAECHSVLNVKALIDTFNQDKALVGAFSVIVKTDCVHTGTVHTVPALQFKLMKGFC